MKLERKVIYKVEEYIEGLGNIVGVIEIKDDQKLTPNRIQYPINLCTENKGLEDYLELDYSRVHGLGYLKGKLTGDFSFPNKVPLTKDYWKFERTSEFNRCVDKVYEILEKIVEKEVQIEGLN